MVNKKILVCATLLTAMSATFAYEQGGKSVYPQGVENFMSGALPPPGTYGMVFGNVYRGDVKDNNGNNVGVKVDANVVAPRFVWVPGVKVLEGDLVAHVIAPIVDLKVTTPGGAQSKTGLGDLTVGLGVGYHHSPNLHSVVAVDAYLPTGGYTKGDTANIGSNHSAIEPVYAISYINPTGFNGDIKLGYIINQRNSATDYKAGDEFHFDYAAGWGLGNGWTVGVGGFYAKQFSDDKKAGAAVLNNRYSAVAIGPNVKYDSGKGWFVSTKLLKESSVKNGAGGDSLWVKAVFPF